MKNRRALIDLKLIASIAPRPAPVILFESCLPVVTLFAQRLPVLLIPEQCLISPVRLDMVDYSCRSKCSCPLALDAKRVTCQEPLPRHLPAMAVAAFKCAGPITSMNWDVKLAIWTACQTWTAGMLARTLGLHRHVRQPPLRKEKPSKPLLQGLSAFL